MTAERGVGRNSEAYCAVCNRCPTHKTSQAHTSIQTLQAICLHAAGPISGIYALLNKAVKGGIGPIGHSCHMAVLDRVEVQVIHMRAKVRLIADAVFPVTPLPDATLAPGSALL